KKYSMQATQYVDVVGIILFDEKGDYSTSCSLDELDITGSNITSIVCISVEVTVVLLRENSYNWTSSINASGLMIPYRCTDNDGQKANQEKMFHFHRKAIYGDM